MTTASFASRFCIVTHDSDSQTLVANRRKSFRVALGWNQKEAAKAAGLSLGAFAKVERARPRAALSDVQAAAEALGVPLADYIGAGRQ